MTAPTAPEPRTDADEALDRLVAAKPVEYPPLPADPHDRRLAMNIRGW